MARPPFLCLLAIVAFSLGARALYLERPCDSPCKTPSSHTLIFDEAYYVNAARAILGRDVPAGEPYAGTPAGRDPNAEHPQLAKLAMAGGIALFGDTPLGWRAGSLIAGTLVLLLLVALVRAAGGSDWLAVGVAGVAALDNLLLVHGRIAMLDIYTLAFMLAAATLYLRDRPVLAGMVLGLGACTKLVGAYLLFAFGVLEGFRWLRERTGRGTALALCIAATGASYGVALQAMDSAVRPYDGRGNTYTTAVSHTRHMLDHATKLTSPHGPRGIASYPWTWLTGHGQIPYATVTRSTSVQGRVVAREATIAFKGAVNPYLLLFALPALALCAWGAWRDGNTLDLLAVSWFLGTMVPFAMQATLQQRTTYVYYLVVTMPALLIAAARLFSRLPPAASIGWAVLLIVGFSEQFPFRDLF